LKFKHIAASLHYRLSNQCGPEASSVKKQWKEICNLHEKYKNERNIKTAANLLLKLKKHVEQLRDGFVILHNRFYGSKTTKQEKALAWLVQHPHWTDTRIAKAAGFSYVQELYKIPEYTNISRMLQDYGKRKANIPRGTKDEKTSDIEAW